jgi:hypothetical protein
MEGDFFLSILYTSKKRCVAGKILDGYHRRSLVEVQLKDRIVDSLEQNVENT